MISDTLKNEFLIPKPIVMGILNLTPDSFFDGGKYNTFDSALKRTETLISEGASIVDIGAVSTRPGAELVSEREEITRMIPVLKILVKEFPDTVFSIDTFRAEVAKVAVKEGASIINDISGGDMDVKMLEAVSQLNVPYILMHMKGIPQNMQINPVYKDMIGEMLQYFREKIKILQNFGHRKIILDPGFGFGKTLDDNYEILDRLSEFKQFGFPLLVGISRKSMINRLLNIIPEDALNGTSVLNTIALLRGADILRVHDVKEAMEAVSIVNMLEKASK